MIFTQADGENMHEMIHELLQKLCDYGDDKLCCAICGLEINEKRDK